MTLPRRPLLFPLNPLYAAAQRLHSHLLAAGRLRTHTLPALTLSVGSLSAGGAGKTPVVLALAQLLATHGFAPCILSRGYGRRSTQTLVVDPAGDPAIFGDEPLLLARRSGVPVIVGPSRYFAGLLALTLPTPAAATPIFLLDDGFQHRRLTRHLDLVLLTAQDLRDSLLPAGNLREPLAALRRAQLILLRDDEAPTILPHLPPGIPTALIHRTLTLPPSIPDRPLFLSGIARPRNFADMLQAAGAPSPVAHLALPDHHRYTPATIARILRLARQSRANALLTTEKDAVKLSDPMREQLRPIGPLLIPSLTVTFPAPATLLNLILHLTPQSPACDS